MNRNMPQDHLTKRIARFGRSAIECRQLTRQLRHLLPLRFQEIRREYARQGRGGKADRRALTDERYLQYLQEFNDLSHEALLARIQYDTHRMLFEARRSITAFHRPDFDRRHPNRPPQRT